VHEREDDNEDEHRDADEYSFVRVRIGAPRAAGLPFAAACPEKCASARATRAGRSDDMVLIAALLIGVIAGLRTFIAPAAVSWAARLGVLELGGTPLAFLGSTFACWVLTIAALGELVADQLPQTPSRKTPAQFGGRIVSGALCGAAVGMAGGSWPIGAAAGIVGAILGTLGGSDVRGRLATAFHKDRPAALLEDVVAIGGAVLILAALA
jgi:uncharacterized membrane protein